MSKIKINQIQIANGFTIEKTGAGSATINFGSFPGSNEAQVTFSDTSVTANSKIMAYFSADTSSDHTLNDHLYASSFINLMGLANTGVGGIIYARSLHKMQGQWTVRYKYTI